MISAISLQLLLLLGLQHVIDCFSFFNPIFCIGLFYSFSLFFFILLWSDNFKRPVFDCTDSFFCLITSSANAPYCTFFPVSFATFFSSIISIQFFFHSFYSIEFLIFLMLLNCLCFLVAHWTSLKQLFWIIYCLNHRSPCLLGSVSGKLCSFSNVTLPWFFTFLAVLHYCLCIWRNSHLLYSLPICFFYASNHRFFFLQGLSGTSLLDSWT